MTIIRKLKAIGITVVFVNYDQTSSDSSEFMLTLLSAIAQEESSNTSRRVKFGKKQNAEKGRVPNFVYGYDKIPDDYFNLNINESESNIVREIFDMYVNQGFGETKIALELNRRELKTKRGCNWSQNAISRILTNQIYTGKIINGKQEVEDFLTGKRKNQSKDKWIQVERPDLRLIDDITFHRVEALIAQHRDTFKHSHERDSHRNIFSKLIKCTCCGCSFRRSVRTWNKTSIKWTCTGRNANGVDACPNKTSIDEKELLDAVCKYFRGILSDKPNRIRSIIKEFNQQYQSKDDNKLNEQELKSRLLEERKLKNKQIEMYEHDIITVNELIGRSRPLDDKIVNLENELKLVKNHISKSDVLQMGLNQAFQDIDHILNAETITNELLCQVLDSIRVNEKGEIDVYLKILKEVGLPETVHISDDRTQRCGAASKIC